MATTDADSDSEEENRECRQSLSKKRQLLKSGKLRTADSMVMLNVTWTHELGATRCIQ